MAKAPINLRSRRGPEGPLFHRKSLRVVAGQAKIGVLPGIFGYLASVRTTTRSISPVLGGASFRITPSWF